MNQALSFGLLLAGGILITSVLEQRSISSIVQGQPGSVSGAGDAISAIASNGVAGAGAAVSGAATGLITAVTQAASPSTLKGYVDPFSQASSLSAERIDQGQDFSMAPGSPILAPGDSKVLGILPNWFDGEPYVALQLTSGPLAGHNYYLAEQINPTVKPGQTVKAGQQIATYASSGTGIEIGWAGTNWQQTLAQATTGYTEGQQTHAGDSFHQFLIDIGAIQ